MGYLYVPRRQVFTVYHFQKCPPLTTVETAHLLDVDFCPSSPLLNNTELQLNLSSKEISILLRTNSHHGHATCPLVNHRLPV